MDNKLLKVSGILLIITGGISVLLGILAIAALAALGLPGILILGLVISLIGSVISLIAGIIGVKNSARPEKAKTCMVFGIIVIALTVLSIIFTLVGDGDVSLISLLSGLIVPIIYLVGAVQNKKLHDQYRQF
ncbi:MAG: hypothetical protein ACOYCB_01835 [Fastidiosipilaceae bacterium]|jgi:hypothetical protein|nr:hypothetical protein [Clostridiaceae bacterium]